MVQKDTSTTNNYKCLVKNRQKAVSLGISRIFTKINFNPKENKNKPLSKTYGLQVASIYLNLFINDKIQNWLFNFQVPNNSN